MIATYNNLTLHIEAFGECQTNAYILQNSTGEIIIDPGVGATTWIKSICKNPLAIFNTHGHYDHVWSNKELQDLYPNIPLVIHQEDAFLLKKDIFGLDLEESSPTQLINQSQQTISFGDFTLTWRHFPGHTPGSCTIETDEFMVSGDFIFHRSIGRYDFPFSSAEQMKSSLQAFKQIPYDKPVYPGHGISTSIKAEQPHLDIWLSRL